MESKTISFFGLGAMGTPMAGFLAEKYKVIVYNRTIEKALSLKQKGAEVASTIEEALTKGDIYIAMIFDYDSVYSTFLSSDERRKLLANKTIIQISTVSPAQNLKLKQEFESAGCEFIENPVVGTASVAEARNLQSLFGGTKEQFEKYRELLTSFGPTVRYIGEIPAASNFKMAFNQIVLGEVLIFAQSLGMVQNSGLDVEQFMETLRNSQLYSKYFDIKMPSMLNRDFSKVLWDITGAFKDISVITDTAKTLGIDTTALEGMRSIFEKASKENKNADFSSVYNTVNKQ